MTISLPSLPVLIIRYYLFLINPHHEAINVRLYEAIAVAGQTLLKDNAHTGAYPGQLLRGPLAHN